MHTLTILVGLPASGKSTFAETLKDDNTVVLSSDAIRLELFGYENDQSNNSLVFTTLYARAKELLQTKNVVIDSTNINREMRAKSLAPFRDMNIQRVAIVFDTPTEICIERDSMRTRTVGRDVIVRFANLYQRPDVSEGFDKIEYKKLSDNR